MADSDLDARTPAQSASTVSELMMPGDVNNLGHVFGGVVLSMVDRAAAVAAMRHCGGACVTVSIDRVDFQEPIYSGELVTCEAMVNYVGRTSMEVGVKVHAENLMSGERRHTNTCYLTFVAIDEEHRPVRVPPLELETEEDERRFREGKRRRQVREALARELEDPGDSIEPSIEPLSVGDTAPDFALPLTPGEAPLRLGDYLGQKPVVLLFFPLAFSGVCTKEMRLVTEDYATWEELDAEIIGISVDSPFVTMRFAEECGAPFPIVSDFNREAVDAYGVRNDDFYGLEGVARRSAFVVDRGGKIAYAWMAEDSSILPDFEAVRRAVEGAS